MQLSAAFLRQSRLDLETLRRSEDTFVDELFSEAPRFGVPLMRAHFPARLSRRQPRAL
jgi:N-formylglutamate amidohydrolase